MKSNKTTFNKLSELLNENVTYVLNNKGRALLQRYLKLLNDIEQNVLPVVSDYVVDKSRMRKQIAIEIITSINSLDMGTDEFKIMSRLDTLTNSGRNPIDGSVYVFSEKDPIMKYLTLNKE